MAKAKKKKTSELFLSIKEALDKRDYYFTAHAFNRSKQRRNVDSFQVIRILKSKCRYHEPKKDVFTEEFNTWNYAIRGKSIDNEDIRIILTFDECEMLIITVINLDE